MKKAGVSILVITLLATAPALAQAPVSLPPPTPSDTIENVEQSSAYQEHLTAEVLIHAQAQKELDSLFSEHDQILNTLKAEAHREWEAVKSADTKTLKSLKDEEVQLKKELQKEKQKNNNTWLNKQWRKSIKKTKYEATEESQ